MRSAGNSFEWFPQTSHTLSRRIVVAVIIFLVALGVRALYWSDHHSVALANNTVVTELYYRPLAQSLVIGNVQEFIQGPAPSNDATVLGHPPGYPLLIALATAVSNNPDVTLQFFQLTCDALSVVLIFLIAAELLPLAVGVLASGLIAFSPKYAFYSLVLTPESIAVMPVLLATLLIIKAAKRPSYGMYSAAGSLIGVSCWLRADALLLAPFLAIIIIWFGKANRWRYGLTVISGCVVVIAPITIRNLIVFDRFVPLSLGAGTLMLQGIGDYDAEKRFGIPMFDTDMMRDEAKTSGEPEYGRGLWTGDGINRDGRRLARSFDIIRAHPFWFTKVMTRRAYSMFDEDYLSLSPKLMSSSPIKDPVVISDDVQPVWSASPTQLYKSGLLARHVQVAVKEDGGTLRLQSDYSLWGAQITSSPIHVRKHTRYVFRLAVATEGGRIAFFIKSADFTNQLATFLMPDPIEERTPKAHPLTEIQIPFDSQNEEKIHFVIAEGGSGMFPIAQIGPVELFESGVQPSGWTAYPRAVLRNLQQISIWAAYLSLAVLGLSLLIAGGLRREAIFLVAIPVYYLCAHSVLHLEQRYVLPMYYLLMVASAVPFYWAARAAKHGSPVKNLRHIP